MSTAAPAGASSVIDLALTGASVVVTGAGSGIGAATARLLGAAGASVALVGRRAELLEKTAEEVRTAGGRAVTVPADLADPGTPDRVIATAREEFGGIDGL